MDKWLDFVLAAIYSRPPLSATGFSHDGEPPLEHVLGRRLCGNNSIVCEGG